MPTVTSKRLSARSHCYHAVVMLAKPALLCYQNTLDTIQPGPISCLPPPPYRLSKLGAACHHLQEDEKNTVNVHAFQQSY